jgi:hypothetical protein
VGIQFGFAIAIVELREQSKVGTFEITNRKVVGVCAKKSF